MRIAFVLDVICATPLLVILSVNRSTYQFTCQSFTICDPTTHITAAHHWTVSSISSFNLKRSPSSQIQLWKQVPVVPNIVCPFKRYPTICQLRPLLNWRTFIRVQPKLCLSPNLTTRSLNSRFTKYCQHMEKLRFVVCTAFGALFRFTKCVGCESQGVCKSE